MTELQPIDSATEVFPRLDGTNVKYLTYSAIFNNHSDLRRILTDYGFDGHPMRKDFPLTGHDSVEYDETEKTIVMRPLEQAQEFRSFDFQSPWDQVTNASPDIVHIDSGDKDKDKQ